VESLKNIARRVRDTGNLTRRVEELEAEVQECRQLNLRLAELTDVVTELLLPAADRDEARIAEVLQSYRDSVNDPPVPGTR
jgi:hypothetical protein